MAMYPDDGTTWTTWTNTTGDSITDYGSWSNWNTNTSTASTTSGTWYDWTNNASADLVHYTSGDSWVTWITKDEAETQLKEEKRKNRLERRKIHALTDRKERKRQAQLQKQQKKEELAQKQEVRRQEKIKQRQKRKAEATAWKLLEDVITPEETKHYKKTGRLLVHGQEYDWLIKKPTYEGGKPGVVRVEKNKLTDICVHTNGGKDHEIPEGDRILSLALSAKFNEKDFNEKCNKWGDVQMPDEYLKECGNF